MGKVDDERCVFPLTSLQIGDLQSYLSDLTLFLAIKSRKSYILVDNRPWLRDLGSRPAQLWQLMVTKSRMSPFANTKLRRDRNEGAESYLRPKTNKPKRFQKWFSLVDAVTLSRKRILIPVKNLRKSFLLNSELQRTLYGFIVFEVEWSSVRGINYLNELQTDTSMAIEAKYMLRWEFNSIAQASACISSWFSGSPSEQLLLKEYLDSAAGETFYDADETFMETNAINDDGSICDERMHIADDSVQYSGSKLSVYSANMKYITNTLHTPPPTGPYKRRRVMESTSQGVQPVEVDSYIGETDSNDDNSSANSEVCDLECESSVEATKYKDVLILFKFNDHDLPFKLRRLIMSDTRLLTLLEAGLPSWAIFLQSYPGFCNLYRPWMCPLARALYVLVSVVTVLIGFYDLYKNVPVLKATASRLCGPLFDWIEDWEMVSRIKYLGTMLFLHNFEKAVKWFLSMTRTTRSFFSVIAQPLAEPLAELFGFLFPIWNVFIQVVGSFCSVIFIMIESFCNLVGDLVEILLSPVWFIISTCWSIVISVLYPILWITREILYAPIRMVLSLAGFFAYICTCIYEMVGDIWWFFSSMFQLASSSEATVSAYEPSIWRSLWNDLFSQVFRALRSILNGFVAFFTACNRHRLSIYNHIQEFFGRYFGHAQTSDSTASRHGTQSSWEPESVGRRPESGRK